ncbi:trypsin-like serine protease [Mesorhizobium sp.]|uniref:trypsin-like serine protease n=1 Tax=Mesorhizobium sp. TaxID=1871066 RepID=UPI00343E442C
MAARRLFSALLSLALGSCATSDLDFESVPSVTRPRPKIIGGQPTDSAKFPATLIIRPGTTPTRTQCTATVVGRRSILTAAHCLEGASKGQLSLNGKYIPVTCEKHPRFTGSDCLDNPLQFACAPDIALCYSASDIVAPGLKYETLNSFAARPVIVGDSLTLLGYGCTSPGGSPVPGLYMGRAVVKSTSKDAGARTPEERFIVVEGGAQGCRGDSGGAVFDKADQPRKVVGVLSNGRSDLVITRLVSTRDNSIIPWISRWGTSLGTKICGVHGNAPDC